MSGRTDIAIVLTTAGLTILSTLCALPLLGNEKVLSTLGTVLRELTITSDTVLVRGLAKIASKIRAQIMTFWADLACGNHLLFNCWGRLC